MGLYRYRLALKPEQVHDGDSCTGFDIDLGFKHWLHDQSSRLFGVDTPEMHPKAVRDDGTTRSPADIAREQALAVKARDHVRNLVSKPGACVEMESVEKPDKFGRLLSRMYVSDDAGKSWTDVAQSLIAAGLARPYDGGKKQPW